MRLLISKCLEFRTGIGRNFLGIVFRQNSTDLRNYQFPELAQSDLEEQWVTGSGPGGSNVNKSRNCVLLKHVPTGLIVRAHDTRSVYKNRELALKRLQLLLDSHLNGDNSYTAIKKRQEAEEHQRDRLRKEQRRLVKLEFKKLLAEQANSENKSDS